MEAAGGDTRGLLLTAPAMKTILRDFQRDEAGATALEYGLIIAMISILILGALSALDGRLTAQWQTVADFVASGG
jgi:pilus assembly protein Flp/PilA